MKLNDEEFNYLVVSAVRNALGGSPSRPGIIYDVIMKNFDNLSEASVNNIIFEIQFVYKLGLLRDQCDIDGWLSLKKELKNENEKRIRE